MKNRDILRNRPITRVVLRCLSLLVILLFTTRSSAMAGPTEDAARDASKRGVAAYNLGSYEEAAKHYEEAYRLIQSPDLLFNIGQSWRLAGKPDKALTAYKSYLRTAPADVPNRESVERRVTELERTLTETKAAPPSPPAPHDSLPPRKSAPPLLLPVVEPEPMARAAGDLNRPASVTESAESAQPTPLYHRWWFWTGAGALVAGIVVGSIVASSGATRATSCGVAVDSCAPVRR